jgi:CheY-like chemotaxis protein/HPt (histidine-containing phosphotransfer) domain-containing protein
VLIADDNRTNQRLVELLLESDRHQVTTVSSGREAVEQSAREPFDLILMDVQMPGMDGFEATAAIRERERATGAHTPIAAMTAHAMAGDREKCLAAGMDAYLSKPLRPDDLAATIDALVPAGRALGAAESKRMAEEARLLADFGHNGRALAEVIGVFLVDCPKYLEAIRRARVSGDARAAAEAIHALKGSAGLFSRDVYESVRLLELVIKAGDPDADARHRAVESEVVRLCEELDGIRKKLETEQ